MICRLTCLLFLLAAFDTALADVTAKKTKEGVKVEIDGKPFATYLMLSGNKPIVWPVIGPAGKPMTRAHPMGEGPNERKDHAHHRSLWFTHGSVNGVSFWDERKGNIIKHREFVKVQSGKAATIVTRNDWLGPEGKKVCEDERTLTFGTDGENRWIDFDITIKATDGPVKFGDTKEGTMGVRVPGTMKVDAGKGGKLINSKGETDKAAWGKQAPWVDYNGPVDGETVGLAILNHPSSFRFPTFWHVRTYGLFAANPFFKEWGAHTLPAGESIAFRYRILLHRGDEKSGKVADAYAAYAKEKK